MFSFRVALLTGVAAGLLSWSAQAATVSPGEAKALEGQVRDWFGGLLGPSVKLTDSPVKMTAAGDHYDVSMSVPVRPESKSFTMTAVARPLDGGKWSIENVRVPSTLDFVIDMPMPTGGDGKGAKEKGATTPMHYTGTISGQDGRATWDPTFATPSTWTTSLQGMKLHAEGGTVVQDSTIGQSSSVTTLRPAGQDRIDVLAEGSLQDYHIISNVDGDPMLDLLFNKVRVSTAMNGVSRAKGVTIVQALTTIVAKMGPQDGSAPPKVAPEVISAVLDALQDFATDMTLDESIDGLTVKAGGQSGTLAQVKFGFSAKSDKGLLQAAMDLGAQGLTLPDLPLGEMEALIPKRFAIRPMVSGISTAELSRIARASANGRPSTPGDLDALFKGGGVTAGLESMALEVAGAVFGGSGKMVFTSPTAFSGTAQVTAENFDALMQKISTMPALAGQAVPVMALAKGMGRTSGSKLIWDIVYKDNKVLVNNVDLMAMAGGGAPPADAPKAPAQRPNRTR